MNICCFLLTRFLKIFLDKRLGQVFGLKNEAEVSTHMSAKLLKPYENTKSLTESLKSSVKCFRVRVRVIKKLVRVIKKLGNLFVL